MGTVRQLRRNGRRRAIVLIPDAANEVAGRRLVILGLLAALLVIGLMTGIWRLSSSAHHAAGARRPASPAPGILRYGLVGGGGVVPRHATGKLAIAGSVGQVLFFENGTALDSYAREVIGNAALAIRTRHLAAVTVTGYTDAIGSAPANIGLARRRAGTVLAVLRKQLPAKAIRYRTQARGQQAPVASNSAPAGRQLNRRVLITAS